MLHDDLFDSAKALRGFHVDDSAANKLTSFDHFDSSSWFPAQSLKIIRNCLRLCVHPSIGQSQRLAWGAFSR
jgi:hypothetical protein